MRCVNSLLRFSLPAGSEDQGVDETGRGTGVSDTKAELHAQLIARAASAPASSWDALLQTIQRKGMCTDVLTNSHILTLAGEVNVPEAELGALALSCAFALCQRARANDLPLPSDQHAEFVRRATQERERSIAVSGSLWSLVLSLPQERKDAISSMIAHVRLATSSQGGAEARKRILKVCQTFAPCMSRPSDRDVHLSLRHKRDLPAVALGLRLMSQYNHPTEPEELELWAGGDAKTSPVSERRKRSHRVEKRDLQMRLAISLADELVESCLSPVAPGSPVPHFGPIDSPRLLRTMKQPDFSPRSTAKPTGTCEQKKKTNVHACAMRESLDLIVQASSGTSADLIRLKSNLKTQLRQYDHQFKRANHRPPNAGDREPMRMYYIVYDCVKLLIQRGTSEAAAALREACAQRAKLDILKCGLSRHEADFLQQHGRPVQIYRDVLPVQEFYDMYRDLRAVTSLQ